MSKRSRAGFEAFVLGLPGVTLVEQWGAIVAKVGGKVFALQSLKDGGLVFKVGETSFAGLTSLAGVSQAPYFAKGQWVSIAAGAPLLDDERAAYLREAHRLIAAKLTKKLRAELGLGS